jgi:hypothetical protein
VGDLVDKAGKSLWERPGTSRGKTGMWVTRRFIHGLFPARPLRRQGFSAGLYRAQRLAAWEPARLIHRKTRAQYIITKIISLKNALFYSFVEQGLAGN